MISFPCHSVRGKWRAPCQKTSQFIRSGPRLGGGRPDVPGIIIPGVTVRFSRVALDIGDEAILFERHHADRPLHRDFQPQTTGADLDQFCADTALSQLFFVFLEHRHGLSQYVRDGGCASLPCTLANLAGVNAKLSFYQTSQKCFSSFASLSTVEQSGPLSLGWSDGLSYFIDPSVERLTRKSVSRVRTAIRHASGSQPNC